jgi:hypothetical protein
MSNNADLSAPRRTLLRALRDVVTDRKIPLRRRLNRLVGFSFPVLTMPFTVWFLFENRYIHEGYRMTWLLPRTSGNANQAAGDSAPN